jgi:hypothetical protein
MSKLTDMLDKYRKSGSLGMKVGILADKTYPDGMKVAHVGWINDQGAPHAHIPSRPFFRETVFRNQAVIPKMVAALLKNNEPETVLRLVGEHMAGEFTDAVMTWKDPPNAQSTIDAKGYDAPLRANDKLLRNSFSYEIEQ